jgi:exosortase/archaeosortase family protein
VIARLGRVATGLAHGVPDVRCRAGAFSLLGIVAALNGFAGSIAKDVHQADSLDDAMKLGGLSAIVWFSLVGLFLIGGERSDPYVLTPRDRLVLIGMALLAFVPVNIAGAMSVLLGGTYLAVIARGDSSARRVAVLMLALTGPLVWGRVLLTFWGPLLLGVDARFAALIAGVPSHGNVVSFFQHPGVLYVALGCSSLHNMSLAVLLFATLTQMLALRLTPRLLATCALGAISMGFVNILRLAALARYPDHFDYLHTGPGGYMFGVASFVMAGVVIGAGIVAATRDP